MDKSFYLDKAKLEYIIRNKWYYFPIVFLLVSFVGVITLSNVDEKYNIEALLQISESQTATQNGQQEQFIKGSELFLSNTNIVDEIGSITALSTISETLENLNYQVQTYQNHSNLLGLSKKLVELDTPPFDIRLTKDEPQAINTEFKIFVVDSTSIRVQGVVEKETSISNAGEINFQN